MIVGWKIGLDQRSSNGQVSVDSEPSHWAKRQFFKVAWIKKMTKINIPTPICSTCGELGGKNYISGETSYLCPNCGTEMRYLPAGELLISGSSDVKKNSGWITKFSVLSSELYSGRAMFGIGALILVLALSFLYFGKIRSEDALWSLGSGILLVIIGKRKSIMQKKKMQTVIDLYPYWKK